MVSQSLSKKTGQNLKKQSELLVVARYHGCHVVKVRPISVSQSPSLLLYAFSLCFHKLIHFFGVGYIVSSRCLMRCDDSFVLRNGKTRPQATGNLDTSPLMQLVQCKRQRAEDLCKITTQEHTTDACDM
jgi:hypothetical protein